MLLCVGLNYRKHAQETGNAVPRYPIVFAKNLSAVQDPHGPVVLPVVTTDPPEVDYEAELAFVIGRPCKNVAPDRALEYVLGFMCANDISARRWQGKRGGGQWYIGKSFDTFSPLGPELVATAAVGDPQALGISLELNGMRMQVPVAAAVCAPDVWAGCTSALTAGQGYSRRGPPGPHASGQHSNTADMIFDVRTLVSFLSQETTLLPGTVVLTGTPEGVGYTRKPPVLLKPGDRMRVTIDKLGTLENHVVASDTPAAVFRPDADDGQPPQLRT
jgi:2-keto-4-pentenoate hydratase/2-oxohepta-3-ene-1,7-dioic acid hydratase in catechol pathway